MLSSAPVTIEAATQHTASMIFLHGLGDTGYGWAPVMRQLAKKFRFMKFILPHAPQRSITLNAGMSMPAWYDIYTLSESDDREDEVGVRESANALLEMIKTEEKAGIPRERIFIGGFSQGAALSLFTTLNHAELGLGGVVALSGYIPCRRLMGTTKLAPRATPIFMAHGTQDMVIQYRWHQHSVKFVEALGGAPLRVRAYEGMQHSACEEEVADVAEFMDTQLQTASLSHRQDHSSSDSTSKREL